MPQPSPTRWFRVLLINLLVTVGLLVLVEGCASLIIAGRNMGQVPFVAERSHTEYDEEIGWINRPNVHVRDQYGPGIALTTNAQRHRGLTSVEPVVPAGRTRLICSGDSFTLGYGVNDDETWCHLLGTWNPDVETVNLGQGGYGVDQAYLWYLRNADLAHDSLIFAFITDDFLRMASPWFNGYGRPLLRVRDGVIRQTNRPVPRRLLFARGLGWLRHGADHLRVVELFRRAQTKLGQRPADAHAATGDVKSTQDVASAILAHLQQHTRDTGRRMVLLYLPAMEDYRGQDQRTDDWRAFIRSEAERHGYEFVDLVEAVRTLPEEDAAGLWLPGDGHLTVAGNVFVARALSRVLLEQR